MFFEDSVRNIQAGKRVGLHTVLVRKVLFKSWVIGFPTTNTGIIL